METSGIYLFLLTQFVISVSFAYDCPIQPSGSYSVEMQSNSTTHILQPGENVLLSCEFLMYDFDVFCNPILWKKSQFHEGATINRNINIEAPFHATGRFKVGFDRSPPYSLSLTIRDVRPEDSGNYTCEVMSPDSIPIATVVHYVFVTVPVESLVITTKNITENVFREPAWKLNFNEGGTNSFKCVAKGGYPKPKMRIYINCGGTPLDVTDRLKWSQVPVLSGAEGSLKTIQYYSWLSTDDFYAEAEYNRCQLLCAVNLEGGPNNDATRQTVSVELDVFYAPIIKCFNNSALPGDRNANLSCHVFANPDIYKTVWWIDEGYRIQDTSVHRGFWVVEVKDQKTHPFSLSSSLFMNTANESCFRTYTIVAENVVGVTSHTVTLVKKVQPTLPKPFYQPVTDRYPPEYAPVSSSSEKIHAPQNVLSILLGLLLAIICNVKLVFQ